MVSHRSHLDVNPAASVRGPKLVVREGKTPVLQEAELRQLFDSLPGDNHPRPPGSRPAGGLRVHLHPGQRGGHNESPRLPSGRAEHPPPGKGGSLEHAQKIAGHADPRTTRLYDRTGDTVSLDEVEKIVF